MTEKDMPQEQDEFAAKPVAGTPVEVTPMPDEGLDMHVNFDAAAVVTSVARRIAEGLRQSPRSVILAEPLPVAPEPEPLPVISRPEPATTSAEPVLIAEPTRLDQSGYEPLPGDRIGSAPELVDRPVPIEPSLDPAPAHAEAAFNPAEPLVEPATPSAAAVAETHVEIIAAPEPAATVASTEQPAPQTFEFGGLPRPSRHRFDRSGSQTSKPKALRHWRQVAGKALRISGYVLGGYLAAVLVLIGLYRFVNPPASTLIAYNWLTGTDVRQTWVPIERISPQLIRAVVVSEDWGFCDHNGIDLRAIEDAIEKAGDGIPRGASTISMQVTKNLFLSQSKSYVRKAIEIPLTMVAELVWPKSRMLEIYLNIAEWGPGIFGAEAAAQHHFAKSARSLGEREAALLAASLPNPMIRDAGDPGPRTARKASIIQSRMRNAADVAECALKRNTEAKTERQVDPDPTKKRAGAALGL